MRIEEGGGGNILSIYRVFYVSRYFLYTNIRTYICIWYATISKKGLVYYELKVVLDNKLVPSCVLYRAKNI